MVTYAQLSQMDTGRLSTAAESAATLSRKLTHHGNAVRSVSDVPGDVWSALDSTAASLKLTGQLAPLFEASDAFRRGNAALEDLVDGLAAAKEHLRGAQELVAGTGITISPSGKVTVPAEESPTRAEYLSRLAGQASAIIAEALRMAETADDTAAAALRGGGDDDSGAVPDFFKDRFQPSIGMDKDGNLGLGLGEGKHRLGVEGPSLSEGPFSINSGSIGLTDNPYPGISLDRWPPKISAPFVDVSAPNVKVDVGQLGEDAKDTAEGVLEYTFSEGKRESVERTIESITGIGD